MADEIHTPEPDGLYWIELYWKKLDLWVEQEWSGIICSISNVGGFYIFTNTILGKKIPINAAEFEANCPWAMWVFYPLYNWNRSMRMEIYHFF